MGCRLGSFRQADAGGSSFICCIYAYPDAGGLTGNKQNVYYDGGCVEMRDAAVCVRENDWQGAYDLWKSLFDHSKSNKLKIKSAFNLALASEMQGDLPQAEKWMKEVEKRVTAGSDEEAVWKFYAAQLAERSKDFPYLNAQMVVLETNSSIICCAKDFFVHLR